MWGKTSDTQVPDWPCWLNFLVGPNSLGLVLVKRSMNANRLPSRKESGVGRPWNLASSGR